MSRLRDRPPLAPAAGALAVGAVVLLAGVSPAVGATAAMGAVAVFAHRARMWWLAACAAAWTLVFVAVLVLPGPYDSGAGPAVVPVLAGYAFCFLGGWALGRWAAGRRMPPAGARPALEWPPETRLRVYLGAVLAVAVAAAVLRYRGQVPPLLADDPDAARQVLRDRANIVEGLLAQSWAVGLSVSALRALTSPRGRWLYVALAGIFAAGAALGASRNSVLVGVVPALVAALSVRRAARAEPRHAGAARRTRRIRWIRPIRRPWVIVLIGLAAVGAAAVLGGMRTLSGSGTFETEFRARYGGNPVAASVASLDLSLSSSAETFGRLWAQRGSLEPRYGAYTVTFLGSKAEPIVGRTDLYGTTSQLSLPFFMNTATFVAIPLLDYGPVGAAVFLLALGLGVGAAERRLEFSAGPAQQLGRAFIVYFAVFGVYELYPAIQPTWLSLVPGLVVLHLIGRWRR